MVFRSRSKRDPRVIGCAQAYEFEQTSGLREDAKSLGRRLEQVKAAQRIEDPGAIRQELDRGQQSIQRGLKEAFVITGDGTLRLRGFRSYKFDYEMPPPQAFDLAFEDVHLIRDYENNELRALVSLRGFGDQYLYVTREVDGVLLGLLDQTQQTARCINSLNKIGIYICSTLAFCIWPLRCCLSCHPLFYRFGLRNVCRVPSGAWSGRRSALGMVS